jgi:hypothetical protein
MPDLAINVGLTNAAAPTGDAASTAEKTPLIAFDYVYDADGRGTQRRAVRCMRVAMSNSAVNLPGHKNVFLVRCSRAVRLHLETPL